MDEAAREQIVGRLEVAHVELVEHLQMMAAHDAGDPAAASTLPGWSRGHVLTHVARNAEAFGRVLAGVAVGESGPAYPGGAAARNAAIEAGARRPWFELVADIDATATRFEQQVSRQRRWDGHGITSSGAVMAADDVAFFRLRELLVHHADLGDPGYVIEDWPADYVREELRRLEMVWRSRQPMGAPGLPAAALAAGPQRRLAWLLGRIEVEGLEPAGVF